MRSWIAIVLVAAATVVTVVSVFAVMSDASQDPDVGEQFDEPDDGGTVDPRSRAAAPVTAEAPELWDLVQAELVGGATLSPALIEELVVEPVDEHALRWQRLRADRDRDSWAALAVPLGLAIGDRALEPPAPAVFWDDDSGVVAVVEGAEGLDAERQLLAALTSGAIAPFAEGTADGLDDARLARAAAHEGVIGWLDERWLDGLDDDARAALVDDPAAIPGPGGVTDLLRRSGVGLLHALAMASDGAPDGGGDDPDGGRAVGDGGQDPDGESAGDGSAAAGEGPDDDPSPDGPTPLERLLAEPPASTEQVLDPPRYLEPDVPEVVPAPSAGGDVSSSGVLGQLLLRRALSARVDPYDVVAAVEGWAGDRFVTWTDDAARSCVAVRVRSDTFAGRELLVAALDEWSASMTGAGVERDGDRDVEIVSCARLSR